MIRWVVISQRCTSSLPSHSFLDVATSSIEIAACQASQRRRTGVQSSELLSDCDHLKLSSSTRTIVLSIQPIMDDAADIPLPPATQEELEGLTNPSSAAPDELDYLSKLPAELRERIYAEALTLDDPIKINWPISPSQEGTADTTSTILLLKEPDLLFVSKNVREEASAVFYKLNDFTIEIDLPQFSQMTAWLERLVDRCGPRLFSTLHISIPHPIWKHLQHARDLARLIQSSGLNVVPGPCAEGTCLNFKSNSKSSTCTKASLLCVPRHRNRTLRLALLEVVEIAVMAVKEGWEKAKLERMMYRWFKECDEARRGRVRDGKGSEEEFWLGKWEKSKGWKVGVGRRILE
jgi:hypothetical protein